jgi:protein-disulfide isomerase
MYQRLFRSPQALAETHLLQYAKDLKLDYQRFVACLNGEMNSKIEKDQELAKAFGVSVTPTFLIGTVERDAAIKVRRVMRGALPYSTFKMALDELLD